MEKEIQSKISVLMFCPQYLPVIGGAERQAEKLSIALSQHGCRVVIITPQLTKTSPLHEEHDGIVIKRFPLININKKVPWLRGIGILNLTLIYIQVQHFLNKCIDEFDLVHSHIATPLTYFAMLVANKKKKPMLCKIASAGEHNDLNKLNEIGLAGKPIMNALVKNMPIWIAISMAVKQSLIQYNISESIIINIPNGVKYSPVIAKEKKWGKSLRFLYLGRISTTTNRDIPTLIKAFNELAARCEHIELAIVGDGNLFQTIKSHIDKSNYKDRIHLPGQQQPDAWLEWAHCFVLPSRREGLSNALLEAMSNGLACIANDIPPNREVLDNGKAGILVPIEDVTALIAAMESLITNRQLYSHYQSTAFKQIQEKYSIDKVAEQYIQLYQTLLDK